MIRTLIALLLFTSTQCQAQRPSKWKLDSLQHYLSMGSGVQVVNFWATFCKPCIEEMPHFMDVADRTKGEGVSLLLVSLDLPDLYPKKLTRFIKSKKIRHRAVWLDESDADYFIPLVDTAWTGSIPATLISNRETGYRKFIESPLSEKELEAEIRSAMKQRK